MCVSIITDKLTQFSVLLETDNTINPLNKHEALWVDTDKITKNWTQKKERSVNKRKLGPVKNSSSIYK